MNEQENTEIDMARNLVNGIELHLGQLRATERMLIEKQTLEREALEAREQAEKYKAMVIDLKGQLDNAISIRDAAINTALSEMTDRMNEYLPAGYCHLKVVDNRLQVGWVLDGVRSYEALSGGERVSFDLAMAAAFGANLIIKESSELDPQRLSETLNRFKLAGMQVILISCHDIPDQVRGVNLQEGWVRCETPISESA